MVKSRVDIINHLIKKNGYKSYLEIGVDNPNSTFNHIEISKRTGVDPYNDKTGCHFWTEKNKEEQINLIDGEHIALTSDEYFESLDKRKKFDVIFIDGLHLEEQVLKDIENSLKHLKKNGVIIIDDIHPNNKQEAVIKPKFGQGWRGTVYNAIWELRMIKEDLYIVSDKYSNLSFIKKGEQKLYKDDRFKPLHKSYQYFTMHANAILNNKKLETILNEL